MGLGDVDLLDDGDEGRGAGKRTPAALVVSCSICLEAVLDNVDRSWVKLQCGHQFHLDCIGSAFNMKGAMQCPNCRKIEKGKWLYANGSRPYTEISMDDWVLDEDMHDQAAEMSFGVHWCPFSGLTRLPITLDEGDFSSNSYQGLFGHHTIFAEHRPVSSTLHPCPYIAYFAPVHPSSSSSAGSASDGSTHNNNWSGSAIPSDAPGSYAYPSMDVHYHSWDRSTPFTTSNRVGATEQPSLNQRAARSSADVPRHGMLPFIVGNSSASRTPSSLTPSMIPPYTGAVARQRDRVPSVQAYLQQSNSNPATRSPYVSGGRRSSSHRGVAQAVPNSSSTDQSNLFSCFLSSSSGRTNQEPENTHLDRSQSREQEHQPSFQLNLNLADQDSIWGPVIPPNSGSESGRSSGFRHRHGSERMPNNRP